MDGHILAKNIDGSGSPFKLLVHWHIALIMFPIRHYVTWSMGFLSACGYVLDFSPVSIFNSTFNTQWISEFYRSKTKSCVRRCPPGMLIKDFFSRERIGVFERKQQKRRKTALLMKRPDNFHPWFLSQIRNTANENWSVPLSYTLLWGCCKFQPQ